MNAGDQAAVPHVRRGMKFQLMGSTAWLALTLLTIGPARESRFQAAFLLLIAYGFVVDGWGYRANAATLAAARSVPPRWLPWVSGLSYALGSALAVYGLVFLWHPRVAP